MKSDNNKQLTAAGKTKVSKIGNTDYPVFESIRELLIDARTTVYKTVNFTMVQTYWEVGRQIDIAVGDRAEYGKGLLQFLSRNLTDEFGEGFTPSNLRTMRQFYQTFPIRHTLCGELSWSHYRLLIRIDNDDRRSFYLKECAEQNWSVRQLERQINSFFYESLLKTPDRSKDEIKDEIKKLEPKLGPEYILKDPYILEFLDLAENRKYHENELEQALIDNLQKFLLELGKGFSFVDRQKRISADGEHFYIDLVFFNYILNCFVVIDLKTGKLMHQDVGQIDFYVRYYDDKVKLPEHNPTIGILLCSDKNETIAKYSVLADNANLFASKYMLYLPTEEELERQIEREKSFLELVADYEW
ncbi:MAG TPA: PDDEXK nuclease domain-containing protein [Clostridiales bacterium]|jgi:predicted nuclease of restriction endonuclease-like (RecB) superfamily|nr:PDDEXK nuclease domain-containing protein [Clostridiales bacterium]HRT81576.1 PDDEXK nuclease domain-containing protein [Oscillospiraceae bacterium]